MLPLGLDNTDRRVLPRWLRRPARTLERLRAHRKLRLPQRFGLKAGIAFFGATALAGMLLGGHVGNAVTAITAWAGLAIDKVTISGQSETSELEVLQALEIGPASSLLTLDAAAARRRVEALPWVAEAEIRKFYPGALTVTVTERDAFALWQHDGGLSVIDVDGNVLSRHVNARYRSLLVLVGEGANERATEITGLIGRFPELERRVRAAALVTGRRWNLILTNDVEVLLPDSDPERALKKLMAIDVETGLLAGDIVSVDLRLADRFVVGLAPKAAEDRLERLTKARKEAAKNGVRI